MNYEELQKKEAGTYGETGGTMTSIDIRKKEEFW